MGRRKQMQVEVMFVDGVMLFKHHAPVNLPDYMTAGLTEEERRVLPRLKPLYSGALLNPESPVHAEDPEMAALVTKLLVAMQQRHELATIVLGGPPPEGDVTAAAEAMFGKGAAGEDVAAVQMGEAALFALSLYPAMLADVKNLPDQFRWVPDALESVFAGRNIAALDALRKAWSEEKEASSPPSHDKLVALAYRRELVVEWTKSIIRHCDTESSFYVKEGKAAATRIVEALDELATKHVRPTATSGPVGALDYLDELLRTVPLESSVPVGPTLTKALVELRKQRGQMRRFLGYAKPLSDKIKKAVGARFGIKPGAVQKALTRANSKKTILQGL